MILFTFTTQGGSEPAMRHDLNCEGTARAQERWFANRGYKTTPVCVYDTREARPGRSAPRTELAA
jgi:hypothetical protein